MAVFRHERLRPNEPWGVEVFDGPPRYKVTVLCETCGSRQPMEGSWRAGEERVVLCHSCERSLLVTIPE